MTTVGKPLQPAHSALHKLTWKFIWINYNSEINGNGKPKPNTIIECALKRLEKKIIAYTKEIEIRKRRLDGINETLKLGKGARNKMQPWIELDELGDTKELSNEYIKIATQYGLHKPKVVNVHPNGST